ncbi:MAG: polyprenyl synthetase family protein [Defluviitaleaceae bacterium]|nr:polyprenyl synthetase family protein [Defluviitaleaceae bacterium]
MSIEEAIKETDLEIKKALEHSALKEVTGFLTKSKGKGVRAKLMLIASVDEKDQVQEDVPRAAAALELMHMATLVHDDIIDNAEMRRGVPALHKQFDAKTAVLCGDYLLAISLSMLADLDAERLGNVSEYRPIAREFSHALASVCKGEYIQNTNIGNIDLDLFTYLKIISGKTAALFYIAAYAGAILGGENIKNIKKIGQFGRNFGMAFQIADDLKDYTWSEEEAKKPVLNDLRNGIVTLPLILALKKSPNLREIIDFKTLAVNSIYEKVKAVNGTDDAIEVVRRYYSKAERSIEKLSPVKKEKLLTVLEPIKC